MTTADPVATASELLIGSKNPDKVAEIQALLADLEITVRSLDEFDVPDVEETGESFAVNAGLKASVFALSTGLLTVSDDSGLCVDALGGDPGVYSARYAGEGCSYQDNIDKLLENLKGVPSDQRTAQFIAVLACAAPDGSVRFTVEGLVEGYITDEPRGTKGFGYDPVFYYPPLRKTFAEMEPEEKNRISHRANALGAFRETFLQLRT